MEIDSSKVLGNLNSKNNWEEIWKDKGFLFLLKLYITP
jgi:hypothetical protein